MINSPDSTDRFTSKIGLTARACAHALRFASGGDSMSRSSPRALISTGGPLRRAAIFIAAALATAGCAYKEKHAVNSVSKPPVVTIVKPELRELTRVVGQPSFIESYERSSVYPKMTAYIEKWIVDIGDKVKKGDTLATLYVPELVEDFGTKKATVALDQERVELAKTLVKVAQADVKAADAKLTESKAILAKYQSEVDRWDTEVKRLTAEVKRGVVDPQILLESTNQYRSASASKDAAEATIAKADAELLSKQATLLQRRVEVSVAQRDLGVAESEARRLEAWVSYLKLPAPFDGVIVERNANTFDFVLPSTGDPTANQRAPHLSNSGAAPIYVVDRTDIVRIFVDIPERDANYVKVDTKASVLVRAYRDDPIPGKVTRTSWALNVKSRTLRAEIDLPNNHGELLPGMYAYAKVIIERPKTATLPISALTYGGDRTYCWVYEDSKARRAEVRTGAGDGERIEVTSLQYTKDANTDDGWLPITGDEKIILGDLSVLTDGGPVTISAGEASVGPKGGSQPSSGDDSVRTKPAGDDKK